VLRRLSVVSSRSELATRIPAPDILPVCTCSVDHPHRRIYAGADPAMVSAEALKRLNRPSRADGPWTARQGLGPWSCPKPEGRCVESVDIVAVAPAIGATIATHLRGRPRGLVPGTAGRCGVAMLCDR
jgi:hypothetical protein